MTPTPLPVLSSLSAHTVLVRPLACSPRGMGVLAAMVLGCLGW